MAIVSVLERKLDITELGWFYSVLTFVLIDREFTAAPVDSLFN